MRDRNEPEGLGGWLILPLIGLVISPIRIGLLIATTFLPAFADGSWEYLTHRDSEGYHPLWGPLLVAEMVFNAFFVMYSLFLLVLFFMKHAWFPRAVIIYYLSNLVFIAGDAAVIGLVPGLGLELDGEVTQEIVRALIGIAIWVPYFLVSRRVKNTFVRR